MLIAFSGPVVYFWAWSMNSLFSTWVWEWTTWAIGVSVEKVSQEFFVVLWRLILGSWAYLIAYGIVRGIFAQPEESSSAQGSAPVSEKASPQVGSTTGEKRRRASIPKSVKMYVWKRDEGRCVECGSKEKLEYDHIIPLSKGGSNTDRNLQILCQRCNRSKGASIS